MHILSIVISDRDVVKITNASMCIKCKYKTTNCSLYSKTETEDIVFNKCMQLRLLCTEHVVWLFVNLNDEL